MSKMYKLTVENNDLTGSVNGFLKKLLKEKVVDLLLVPQESVNGKSVLHTLVRNEDDLNGTNLFAPLLLTNSAALVSRLTFDSPGTRLGAVMRSCEVRAAVELIKLKQISNDNLILIGVDCMGTYESGAYQRIVEKQEDAKTLTENYLSKSDRAEANSADPEEIRLACKTCEYPNPSNTDISINFLGSDIKKEVFIQFSGKLEGLNPEGLGVSAVEDNKDHADVLKNAVEKRTKSKDALFAEVLGMVKDVKGFLKELEPCRRCYNCRKECPICYCRECIFDSKTFEHDSDQYAHWAEKKGRIRVPSDTLLFHLTRMNHMAVSCVGCGQCTSACPNGISIARFFKTIGSKVQGVFEYEPGRNVEEEIPQSTFKEEEFPEVGTGK